MVVVPRLGRSALQAGLARPSYQALKAPLRTVLQRSKLAGLGNKQGAALYTGLNDRPKAKAGLLNLYAKMSVTVVEQATTWSYVKDVYRLQGDRIFANVKPEFLDLIEAATAEGTFKRVDGLLHKPPDKFHGAGSFKEQRSVRQPAVDVLRKRHGTPTTYRVDADIDNAAGFEHFFDVVEHWATAKTRIRTIFIRSWCYIRR